MRNLKIYDLFLAIFVVVGLMVLLYYVNVVQQTRMAMHINENDLRIINQFKSSINVHIDEATMQSLLDRKIEELQMGAYLARSKDEVFQYSFVNLPQDLAMNFLVSLVDERALPVRALRLEKSSESGSVNIALSFLVSKQDMGYEHEVHD